MCCHHVLDVVRPSSVAMPKGSDKYELQGFNKEQFLVLLAISWWNHLRILLGKQFNYTPYLSKVELQQEVTQAHRYVQVTGSTHREKLYRLLSEGRARGYWGMRSGMVGFFCPHIKTFSLYQKVRQAKAERNQKRRGWCFEAFSNPLRTLPAYSIHTSAQGSWDIASNSNRNEFKHALQVWLISS